MATPKFITGLCKGPDDLPLAGVAIVLELSQDCTIPGTEEVLPSKIKTVSATDGTWTVSAYATNDLTPNGTFYRQREIALDGTYRQRTIQVPQGADSGGHAGTQGDPFRVTLLETSTPTASPSPNHVSTLTVDAASTFGGASIHPPQTPTQAVLVSGIDASLSEEIQVTLTANRVMGVPLNGVPGQRLHMVITEGGAGGFALTFGAGITVTNFGINMGVGSKTDVYLTCISAGQWVVWSPSVSGQDITPRSVTVVPPGSPYTRWSGQPAGAIGSVVWAPFPSGDTTGATDTAALQAAINALPIGFELRLWSGMYYINAALTDPGYSFTLSGSAAPTFGPYATSGNSVSPVSPFIAGSVIQQVTAGLDGLDLFTSSISVNLRDFGILFKAGLASTGHGINAAPSLVYGSGHDMGLNAWSWSNIYVYGHDGNHYAFRWLNPQLGTTSQLHSYGGGGFNTICDVGAINCGNIVHVHPYSSLFNSGTAGGFVHSGFNSTPGKLNLLTYIRPQCIASGPAQTAGTQYLWDDLAGSGSPSYVVAINPDLETGGANPNRQGPGTKFLGEGLINNGNSTNTAMGYGALPGPIGPNAGSGNTAFGNVALALCTSGLNNTAIGGSALAAMVSSNESVAVGANALSAATQGGNTAVGNFALHALTTGARNTALGHDALQTSVTATDTTAVGDAALQVATGGTVSTAIGSGALGRQTSGGNNTALGVNAGNTANFTTTAQNQTLIGAGTGQTSATARNNIVCLGTGTTAGAAGVVAIGIDHNGLSATSSTQDVIALGTVLHQVQLANNSTGAGSAALGANSPAVTNTAPYTWFKMMSSDGSTVYVPAWK